MTKKVALVIFRYFPYGGLQKDFINTVLELSKRNLDITIFCREWSGDMPNGVKIHKIETYGLSNHKKNQNFYHQLQRDLASLGPDLVFGFNKIPNLDLYFAGDTCYVNSNKQKNFLYKLTPRFKQFSFFEKEVFAQNKKTKILLLNKKQKNIFYEEYKTEESRLNIVPPGLSDDWIDKESSLDLREELGIKKSSKLLLFVGSDFSRKGLDRLIIAFASLDIENGDFYLLIAGDDNSKTFKSLTTKLGINNRVKFMGPRHDIQRLMMNSDLLVHPAREEAAGNVIVEAMASLLPVLVAQEVGYSDLVSEKEAGMVIDKPFTQIGLNKNLQQMVQLEKLNFYREKLKTLSNEFFYSRYTFICNIVEKYLNE